MLRRDHADGEKELELQISELYKKHSSQPSSFSYVAVLPWTLTISCQSENRFLQKDQKEVQT